MLPLAAVLALTAAACGDAGNGTATTPVPTTQATDTTAGPGADDTTMPPAGIPPGTAEMVRSGGARHDFVITEGTCEATPPDTVRFQATAGDIELAVDVAEGSGAIVMMGGFEAEGRVDQAAVDGADAIDLMGIVTEADDTAEPEDFAIMANCG